MLLLISACAGQSPPSGAREHRPKAVVEPPLETTAERRQESPRVEPPARDPVATLVDLLTDADLVGLSLDDDVGEEAPCRGVVPPFRVVSGLDASGEGASCLADKERTACTRFAGHDLAHVTNVLCRTETEPVAAPSWVRALVDAPSAAVDWSVATVPSPEHTPAVSLRIDWELFLLIRRDRWIASAAPVEDLLPSGRLWQLLDARAIPGGPWVAVVTSSYSGGSEMGEEWSRLVILGEEDDRLVQRADMHIGGLAWFLLAEDRDRYPNFGASLRSRPHLEVTLEPSITAQGLIELRPVRIHMPARRVRRWTCTDDDGDLCPVPALRAIQNSVGRWRFEGDRFERVGP